MLQCASGWAHMVTVNGIEVDYSKSVRNSDPSLLGYLKLADRRSLSHIVIAVPGVWKLDNFGNYYFHRDLEGWEVECRRMARIRRSRWFWDFDFTGALVSLAPEQGSIVYVEVGIDAEGRKLYWFNDSAYIR